MALPGQESPNRQLAENPLNSIKVTFIVGAPGSGKGTLCKLLAAKTNAFHLSVGDYLRHLCDDDSSKDAKTMRGGLNIEALRKIMSNRDLVRSETIVKIIKHKMEAVRAQGHTEILLDGFPRDVASADSFEDQVGYPGCVLYFECPRAVAEERFLDRQRSTDDDRWTYAKRYEQFEKFNPKLVERYANVLKTVDTSKEVEKGKESLFAALGIAEED